MRTYGFYIETKSQRFVCMSKGNGSVSMHVIETANNQTTYKVATFSDMRTAYNTMEQKLRIARETIINRVHILS